MKKFLLGLMLCLTALAGATKAPEANAACTRWLTRYYYEAGSTIACGSTDYYCNGPAIHTGCTTPYYQNVRYACSCP